MRTKAGAWAENEAEAKLIEHLADGDEKWEKTVAGRQEWINRPIQPPGLGRSGEPCSESLIGCLIISASSFVLVSCSKISGTESV